MKINVIFFASLVEVIGTRRVTLELSHGSTVADALHLLEVDHPRVKSYRSVLLTALNDEYVETSSLLSDNDELAVFPPVSGGQVDLPALTVCLPSQFYQLTREPIEANKIAHNLLRGENGAVCVFEGVVRNNSKGRATRYLNYEANEAMALKKLREIGESLRKMWPIDSIAMVHRLGKMDIGETAVTVIVTSAHRRPAFDACHYAIDRLKKIVPVWKKEVFEDGEMWVEGES